MVRAKTLDSLIAEHAIEGPPVDPSLTDKNGVAQLGLRIPPPPPSEPPLDRYGEPALLAARHTVTNLPSGDLPKDGLQLSVTKAYLIRKRCRVLP